MDWSYTNRGDTKPVWRTDNSSNNDPSTPRKRPFERASSMHTTTPTFGANHNVPFLFNQPPLPSSPQPAWMPPTNFSPAKAFPSTPAQPEIADVEMNEVSPPKPEESPLDGKRAVAAGALRRVFKSRNQRKLAKHHSQPVARRFSRDSEGEYEDDDDHDEDGDVFGDEDDDRRALQRTTSTSNHFTLNMAAPAAPKSELPYVLLGYLQFFFNLSLILVFLYLLLQFILTVQRDVEKRMADYSMDIVHDIATCALHYQENNCETPFPALKRQCKEWETCMNRDPMTLGRARVVAELIAEVVNGFVEPISWKTLGFTLTSLGFLTVFINTLLSLYRSRHQPPPVAAVPPVPQPLFPVGPYMSPAPTPRWSRTWPVKEEPETPARRRRLEGGNVAKVS
jgi:hypothetical protein